MATLKNRIELEDGVSPVLRGIRNEVAQISPGFSAMQMRSTDALTNVERTSAEAVTSVRNLGDTLGGVSEELENLPEGNITLRVRGVNAVRSALGSIREKLRSDVITVSNKASEAVHSFFGQFTLATVAGGLITATGEKLTGLLGKLMAMSATYSSIQARLGLVAQSAEQVDLMNQRIYESALRARGSYESMSKSVSAIAMTAKEAFPNPQDVIPFLEGIQKLFVIGGTAAQQQGDAMLQLTQALGSGKFQGDEFRSIAEAAPMIEQMVSKYMGVSQGELKQLASDGLVTSEVLKNAILGNMDEINTKFNAMPKTWGDVWTEIGTRATNAFAPVLLKISELANSPAVEAMKNGISVAIEALAAAIVAVIGFAQGLWGILYTVGSYFGTWFEAGFEILYQGFMAAYQYSDLFFAALIGGLALYTAYVAAARIQVTAWMMEEAAAAVWHGITNTVMTVKNGILAIYNLRTTIATVLTRGWTVATIAQTMATRVLNTVLRANPIGLIISLVILVIGAFASWAVATNGVRASIASAFRSIANIVSEVINFIIDRINDAIDAINKLASGINSVFHTKIGIIGKVEHVNQAGDWGDKAYDAVMNFDINKLTDIGTPTAQPVTEKFDGAGVPSYGDLTGSSDDTLDKMSGAAGQTADNTGLTADNTSQMVDSLSNIDEQVKDLRDMALQAAVNNWQVTHNIDIQIDQQNTISGDTDIDGMTDNLVESLRDAIAASPERPGKVVLA